MCFLREGFAAVDCTREEKIKFVQDLIKDLGLGISDCFPESNFVAVLEEAQQNCDRIKQSLLTLGMATAIAPSRKTGYSRSGKKLGRPRKEIPEEVEKTPETLATSKKTEVTVEADAKKPAEKQETSFVGNAVVQKLSAEKSPSSQKPRINVKPDKKVELRELTEAEKREVEKLKMGKEYSLDILYVWRNVFVISNQVLQEAQPLGVVIPYQRKTLDYDKFVLYLSDEMQGMPLIKALSYAKNVLPEYCGNKWQILDRWQIEAAKQVQIELNQILRKIGGDSFAGSYLTEKTYPELKKNDKIRYAVNVER